MTLGGFQTYKHGALHARSNRLTSARGLIASVSQHPSLLLFASFAGLYLATATYGATSIDVTAAEIPAWAVATRGTLDLSAFSYPGMPWFFTYEDGVYSDRFPGAIAYLIPAYWVGDLMGVEQYSRAPGAITAALVTAGTVVVLRQVFRHVLPSPFAVASATFFAGLGTGLWSLAAHAPWSHTCNALLIALALWALASRRYVAAGLVLGLSVTTRPTMAVAAAVALVVLAAKEHSVRPALRLTLGAVPGIVGLITYNGIMFDSWGPSNGHELRGHISPRLSDLPFNVAGILFDPSRGLIFFYPVVLVALVAAPAAWRRAANWEKAAVVAAIAVLFTQLSLDSYTGGDAFFGPRLLVEPLVLAAPFLARSTYLSGRSYGMRPVLLALLMGGCAHGVGGIAAHQIGGW